MGRPDVKDGSFDLICDANSFELCFSIEWLNISFSALSFANFSIREAPPPKSSIDYTFGICDLYPENRVSLYNHADF